MARLLHALHVKVTIHKGSIECCQSAFVWLLTLYLMVQEPERAVEGLGGTYFFKDDLGNKVAIVKPCDEEPLAPNNPKVGLSLASRPCTAGSHLLKMSRATWQTRCPMHEHCLVPLV